MLSAAKVKLHGMQDDSWVIKDKINQYRGLIKLYERDRKIHEGDLAKQKRRYARDIRQLRKDIVVKREQLSVIVYGDKQFLRNVFQEHKRLQLQYMNSQADKVLENIHQENFNKRKKLDRMNYLKKQKMNKFRLIKLEAAEIKDRLLYEYTGKLPVEIKEQAVANYVQKANIRKNAALAIRSMYRKMLEILKKDYTYFGVVMDALKADSRAQGRCLMGATEMGQLAMEYLDDRKYEFNNLEQEIKINMKERKRTLKIVRKEVDYLTRSFPHLLRKEEVGNLDNLYEDADVSSQHSVHWELEEVMGICKQLQRACLVPSFDKIHGRLIEQRYQYDRLSTQLALNSARRNALIEDRKHAILMLDTLKNMGQEATAMYLAEKRALKEQLEVEKREKNNMIKALNEKGQLIVRMKTSLQQINQLLSTVDAPTIRTTDRENALNDLQPVPQMEDDFDTLLDTIKEKLNVLMPAIAKMELTPELRANSYLFYHNVIARSMRDSYKEDVAAEGGLIEFEVDDPNVPTHAIIKLRSKQLVESQVSEFDVPGEKK